MEWREVRAYLARVLCFGDETGVEESEWWRVRVFMRGVAVGKGGIGYEEIPSLVDGFYSED